MNFSFAGISYSAIYFNVKNAIIIIRHRFKLRMLFNNQVDKHYRILRKIVSTSPIIHH